MAELTADDEVLFRQIHPDLIDQGEPSSSNFCPNPQDAGKLSTDRSSVTDEAAAYALYVSRGLASAAVFGVSVGEFRNEQIRCYEDPIAASATEPENLAHALADYSQHTSSQQKKRAKAIKRYAIARGVLYEPSP